MIVNLTRLSDMGLVSVGFSFVFLFVACLHLLVNASSRGMLSLYFIALLPFSRNFALCYVSCDCRETFKVDLSLPSRDTCLLVQCHLVPTSKSNALSVVFPSSHNATDTGRKKEAKFTTHIRYAFYAKYCPESRPGSYLQLFML